MTENHYPYTKTQNATREYSIQEIGWCCPCYSSINLIF